MTGVVSGAVIGTFAAFAGTLAAYKFFDIKVGNKFRMFVMAAVFGMIGLSLMELVLSMFGASFGLFGFGTLGMLTAIAGLVLGVFMLVMDFDFVEQGIANGLPERESWRAAFAMTVSLVWIYTNLLRLLAIFSDDYRHHAPARRPVRVVRPCPRARRPIATEAPSCLVATTVDGECTLPHVPP